MADEPTTDTTTANTAADETQVVQDVQDVLVEEVSIDGMCGVY